MSFCSREVVRYISVGLINTAGGLALIYLCMTAGLGDVIANLVGYVLGLIFSFYLNGKWTFRRPELTRKDFGRFLSVVAIAYLINLAAMLSVRDGLGWGSYIGQLAGVIAYALVGFFGMKFLAFARVK